MHTSSYFLRSSLRRAFPEASILFVPAASPGLVFRALERDAARPAFRRSASNEASEAANEPLAVQLSGPPVFDKSQPWRVFTFAPSTPAETLTRRVYAERIAPLLSRALGGRVFFLHMETGGGAWKWTVWENGEITKRVTCEAVPPQKINLWSRFLRGVIGGAAGAESLVEAEAWAEKHGLPLRRILAETKQKRRTVDYDVVAGLERKGLLVENETVWYRFAAERRNDIIKP